jgi:DNA-binding PadR family transcriptional regulator
MWPFGWRFHRRRGLRLWVLTMLGRSPKNGAEIMDEIEGMTQGWWRPSPGSIYPLLEELTQEGLIRKREQDGKYELTEKAKEEVQWPPFFGGSSRPHSIEDMLNEINGYVNYFEDLNKSDKSRISPYREKIKTLANRLSDLAR